jgi:hypothetical protein
MIDDDLLATTVHDTAIRRLQHAYADVVNRRAWSELDHLFLPDAPLVISMRVGEPIEAVGGGAIAEFIGGTVQQFEFFEFIVLNAHIEFPEGPTAGTAAARLYMCELRQAEDGGRWTEVYGLFHDRYELRSDRWWFAERHYHSLARHGRERDVFPFPEQPGLAVGGIGPGGP